MHRLFLIPELVEVIVHYLVLFDGNFDSRDKTSFTGLFPKSYKDVKSVGLTARLFREASLNAIWCRTYSLVPIVRSAGIVSMPVAHLTGDRIFKIHRRPTPKDFSTILFYTSRIKDLHISKCFCILNAHAVTLVQLPPQQLFPQLRELSCHRSMRTETTFVLNNVGDLLKECIINVVDFTPDLLDLLAQKATSRLDMLSLDHEHGTLQSIRVTNPVRSLLHAAPSLTQIYLYPALGVPVWIALSELPMLDFLEFRLERSVGKFWTPEDGTGTTFRVLNYLKLTVAAVADLTTLLRHSKFPLLEDLFIEVTLILTTSREMRAFTTAVATACASAPLRRITLETDNFKEEDSRGAEYILSNDLRPLLQLRDIEHVDFSLGWQWDLDDSLLDDIVQAWPKLEVLILDPHGGWRPDERRITLRGLSAIVRGCPRLESLGVVFDVTPLEENTAAASPSKWNTTLEHLVVGQTSLGSDESADSTLAIAAFLSGLCPNLRSIVPTFKADFERTFVDQLHVDRWEDVAELVKRSRLERLQAESGQDKAVVGEEQN